jgi:hypothetical protein
MLPPLTPMEVNPYERALDLIKSLPAQQKYEVTRHDPPTPEGYVIVVQLVGPPAMIDGEFIGWSAMRQYR